MLNNQENFNIGPVKILVKDSFGCLFFIFKVGVSLGEIGDVVKI